ncbi:MAG: Lrp/AsnC family transcriptional regulator [Chloroflexota bacterium]
MTRPISFDQLDYQIILELRKDARKSASEIARTLNANERTIRNRIDRLVESGAVRLTSILDPHAFGYVNTVDIFLEVQLEHEQTAIQQLLSMQEVSYLAYGLGTQDISIEARFKDNAEMRHFLGKVLPSIPGVKVKGYALVPRILRNIDEWLPKPEDFEG